MTADAILERLIALFPEFAASWHNPDNYFRDDDGAFTLCGVFAEFSHFFRSRYEQFSTVQIAEIGQFVTDCVADRDAGDATATCFLENVAAERFSSDFQRHLSGDALRFYSMWHESA